MKTEKEAREIAIKREKLIREQNIKTKKHITLDEIGRRISVGSFKELNVVIKGDVDGSIEALSDSMEKLSNEELSVKIIHRGVGEINESDVLLASAADGIIVGFQVSFGEINFLCRGGKRLRQGSLYGTHLHNITWWGK